EIITENIEATSLNYLNSNIDNRINNHREFIIKRQQDPKKKDIKHFNDNLKLPVITSQEKNIKFNYVKEIIKKNEQFIASYSNYRPSDVALPTIKKIYRKGYIV